MSFSPKQIIDRAFLLANAAGIEPHSSAVIDNAFGAELIFPHALREAVRIGAGMDGESESLKRNYALTLTDGEAELPETVLTECLDRASVTGEISDLTGYEPRYTEFTRAGSGGDALNLFAVRGRKFCFKEAGGAAGTFSGELILTAVGVPDVPETLTTAMDLSATLAERTIQILAERLRGARV